MTLFRTLALVVAVVAIGVGGFLYNKKLALDTEVAQEAAERFRFDQQRRCTADGRVWAEEYRRQEQTSAYEFQLAEWSQPEFHYSPELEACLVRTRSVDFRDDLIYYEHQRVTNITANLPVAESSVRLVTDPAKLPGTPPREEPSDIIRVMENLTREEFKKRADDLMTR